MVAKAPIFNGNEGCGQMRRHFAQAQRFAIKIPIGRKQPAIRCKQSGGRLARCRQRNLRPRQIPGKYQQNQRSGDQPPKAGKETKAQQAKAPPRAGRRT
jgi:hypothetical protein